MQAIRYLSNTSTFTVVVINDLATVQPFLPQFGYTPLAVHLTVTSLDSEQTNVLTTI